MQGPNKIVFDDLIAKIKQIGKEQLNEREFYRRVLELLSEINYNSLTSEEVKKLNIELKNIGCKNYFSWKKEKEKNNEAIEYGSIEDGIKHAYISTAVLFVSLFLEDREYHFPFLMYGGKEKGRIKRWLNNCPSSQAIQEGQIQNKEQTSNYPLKERPNIPYYISALKYLTKKAGNRIEQAQNYIYKQSFETIESRIKIGWAMESAVEGLLKSGYLNNNEASGLLKFIYNGEHTPIIEYWQGLYNSSLEEHEETDEELFKSNQEFLNRLIMDTLFYVHDGWVKQNSDKFQKSSQKYKYVPAELIGWKEIKEYLVLYVSPIFEAAEIEFDEERLEQIYNTRAYKFFLEKGFRTYRDLSDAIKTGEKFFPALKECDGILLEDHPDKLENVARSISRSIKNNTIKDITSRRREAVSRIIGEMDSSIIAQLSNDELFLAKQVLEKEVNDLRENLENPTKKSKVLDMISEQIEKNDITARIFEYISKRNMLLQTIKAEMDARSDVKAQ